MIVRLEFPDQQPGPEHGIERIEVKDDGRTVEVTGFYDGVANWKAEVTLNDAQAAMLTAALSVKGSS